MTDRIKLHEIFKEILGTTNVYFQPPESVKLKYPAIVYALNDIDTDHANNAIYRCKNRYTVTLIDYDPDSGFIKKLLALPYCSFDRHFAKDNLNHYIYTIYF